MKKLITSLLVVMLFLPLLGGCGKTSSGNTAEKPHIGGVYQFPLMNEPDSLDPAFVTDGYQSSVVVNTHIGLTTYDEKLKLQPALATSWSISKDNKLWTFHLRKGVKFQDGSTLDAGDVKYSLQRLLAPKTQSPRKNLLFDVVGAQQFAAGKSADVAGITIADPYTVQIRLVQPHSTFLAVLSMPNCSIIPNGSAEKIGAKGYLPGAGPFEIKKWTKGKDIMLQRFDGWYGKKPYLDGIDFIIEHNYEALLADFEKGGLDEAPLVPSADEKTRWQKQGITFINEPIFGIDYIGMNINKPPLNNKKVRQAINYAIDWSGYEGDGVVKANGIIPKGMPGYKSDVAGYAYQPELAQKLLAEAGYPKGLPQPLELWVADDGSGGQLAAYVATQLAQVGIQVKPAMMQWNDLMQATHHDDLQMFQIGWTADYPEPDSMLYPLFYSKNSADEGNSTHYANKAVDSLLDKARMNNDPQKRMQLYVQAEKIIVDDAPVIFMYHYSTSRTMQPWAHGRVINGMGEMPVPMTAVWIFE